jgi:hypothetical protein
MLLNSQRQESLHERECSRDRCTHCDDHHGARIDERTGRVLDCGVLVAVMMTPSLLGRLRTAAVIDSASATDPALTVKSAMRLPTARRTMEIKLGGSERAFERSRMRASRSRRALVVLAINNSNSSPSKTIVPLT